MKTRRTSRLSSGAQRAFTEVLELRRLLCAVHADALEEALARASNVGTNDHDAAWYRPVAIADADGDVSYPVNAAGLPLLTSRADGQGLKVFLDFDGFGDHLPFSTDADLTTFNASEQKNIYDTWRDIVSYFSPFNVNVTTVQPPTGGSNPPFAWQLTSNSISGGYAYVGWIDNLAPHGFTGADNAVNRHSGLAHEIGHLLGLSHQAEYDRWGNLSSEYSDGFGMRDRPIIGVDYAENVRTWIYGRDSDGPTRLIDDLAVMANKIKGVVGGDGYRPDDHGGTLSAATLIPATGATIESYLERVNDVDVFRFTTTGGTWQIDATPTFESAVSPKLELLDAAGNVVAGRDDADQRNGNNNDQEFSLHLAAGTYYVRVMSSGDIGELGEYLFTASPLPTGWTTQDINPSSIFRGGTAAYDPTTGILRQLGGGNDIWQQSDQFRFTSTILNGNGSITARVDSLENVDVWAKAGVMIRQSSATNAPHVYVGIVPSGTIDTIVRASAGATAANVANTAGQTGPWVRLTRTGNSFLLERSANGTNWITVGSTTVNMTGEVLIGFATNSRAARAQAWAQFSNITVTGSLGATAPTYNALQAPTNVTAIPVTAASTGVVLNWNDVDSETSYAIDRSVDGVTYAPLSIVNANVTTYTDPNPFGSMRWFYRVTALSGATRSVPSAGVSVVNKPAAPATAISGYAEPFISLSTSQILLNWADVQGDEGYRIERSSDGGTTYTQIATTLANYNGYNATGLAAGTGYLFRITPITSIGNGVAGSLIISAATRLAALSNLRFTNKTPNFLTIAWDDAANETGYRVEKSINGTSWGLLTNLAAGVTTWTDYAVSAANEYYYRVFATTSLTQSNESKVFTASPTSAALPTDWTAQDVGTVPGAGVTAVTGSTWKLIGAGNDIWNNSDQFHYASRNISGDASISTRILSVENTDTYAKGGVMFRASTAANSAYAFLMYSPGVGLQFEARTSAGTGSNNFGIVNTTARYVRLVRAGNVFTASYSSDNSTWTTLGSVSINMPANITQGLALTSHNVNQLATATFDTLTTAGGVAVNTAPVITVAASADPRLIGTTTTQVAVSATDDGGAANLTYTWDTNGKPANAPDVVFTNNGTNGASSSTATFGAAGNYSLRVTVRDAQGLSVTSSVAVTVRSTLTTLSIVPVSSPIAPDAVQQFSATGLNQFDETMTAVATWSATAGVIDSAGAWTAPSDAGVVTITASSSGLTATTTVDVSLVSLTRAFDVDAATPQVRFTFNGDLGASLSASDLLLVNVGTGATIPTAAIVSSLDPTGRVATFRFAPLAGGVLPDGNYRATIAAGAVSTGSLGLSADATFDFFVLAGDANRDRTVNFDDLLLLAQNYGTTGKTFSQGNFDYSEDGAVNFDDLLILAQRYGTTLAIQTPLNADNTKSTQAKKRDPATTRIGL